MDKLRRGGEFGVKRLEMGCWTSGGLVNSHHAVEWSVLFVGENSTVRSDRLRERRRIESVLMKTCGSCWVIAVMDTLIVVLGSPNGDDGRLFGVAKERCAAAFGLWREAPERRLLLTGGFGEHFNRTETAHAEYLRRELMAMGVPENRFLNYALSLNTLEDASKAKPIVLESGAKRCVVVTSDYHLDRARFVFDREFLDTGVSLEFVATETNEALGEMDYDALKAHEKRALRWLREGRGKDEG